MPEDKFRVYCHDESEYVAIKLCEEFLKRKLIKDFKTDPSGFQQYVDVFFGCLRL